MFEKIPDILKSAKEELRETLIKQLKNSLLIEFDYDIADWL